MTETLDHAIHIATLAGATIKKMREEHTFTEQLKYGLELLTSADIASNDLIISEIRKAYPTHHIISEESPNDSFSIDEPTWIIDPIDGTVSYANGHYHACVSIAYAEHGQVVIGVVYCPFVDELFHAVKGCGSFLNGKPIHVKEVTQLSECLVATGFPYVRDNVPELTSYIARILPHIRDLRRLGSAALDYCWVACGRLQAYYEGSLSPWDMAAGRLIAIEAGATVGHYDYESKPDDLPEDILGIKVLTTSPGVFDLLLATLEAK
ncbi:MAG: inositol monophosphatase [Bacteroidetes bacterium]|nr:inositol monophosphatase [Bacteroidota bacterium]